jgi:hypothetical protein
MTTIHDEEGGATRTSSNVLFEALTLVVWLGAFALLIASVKHARGASPNLPKLIMPVIHLVPWCTALVERRRIRTSLSLTQQDQVLIQTLITRVVWAGYVTLTLVEYWLY